LKLLKILKRQTQTTCQAQETHKQIKKKYKKIAIKETEINKQKMTRIQIKNKDKTRFGHEHIACWVTKATDTSSQYVIRLLFHSKMIRQNRDCCVTIHCRSIVKLT
jgi:tRNA U34 5-carboxymethylaminomethyl modifying enzyme MnmG/GidA